MSYPVAITNKVQFTLQPGFRLLRFIGDHRRCSFPTIGGLSPIAYDLWKLHYRRPSGIIPIIGKFKHVSLSRCFPTNNGKIKNRLQDILLVIMLLLTLGEKIRVHEPSRWLPYSLRLQESNEQNENSTLIMTTSKRVYNLPFNFTSRT